MGRQTSFFDVERKYAKLNEKDRLLGLNSAIPWERFRNTLTTATQKARKNEAGRKPYDALLMFKVLVLQSLYGLSDDEMEFQIRDRLSFTRFLGLGPNDETPDAKTIWLFRETLKDARALEKLFRKFDTYLGERGFVAKHGTIVDACIIEAPKQRMSEHEREQLKEGEIPEDWENNDAMRRQKDTDARWGMKDSKSFYGYKNHIAVDCKYKLIRKWAVTDAATHDSKVFSALVDERTGKSGVWADSAYDTAANAKLLKRKGCKNQIMKQARGQQVLSDETLCRNGRLSRIRRRVEHVFAFQTIAMAGRFIRTIGIARATFRTGMNNLTYNFMRYIFLKQAAA